MSRLVEAKVELAEACDRRDAAQLAQASALNLTEQLSAARRVRQAREAVGRLVREVNDLQAREDEVLQKFGPGVPEELS